ncbi:MAG: acyl-CoA desaturase [Gemmatimonadota bacterium]|nr:MAG: acyl-CoA desaturase [Gemmatimonadota bacterium]
MTQDTAEGRNRFWKRAVGSIRLWFDASAAQEYAAAAAKGNVVDWHRVVPFAAVHLMCFGVIWVGWSWSAVLVALGLYAVRMFAVTGFYHRYFSHRTFTTTRAGQFILALIGASAAQRGPLWWSAHHRKHHRYADTEKDVHSPHQHGFWWAHMGWITSPANFPTDFDQVPDLAKYPELRFLDRFDIMVPLVLAVTLFLIGGWQLLIWGFFISTVVLFHATCLINSLAHLWGKRRYDTVDESRNNWLLAIITFGEGWHNNHHKYPGSTRQGFFWWEFDLTYYGLKVLQWLRIIRDLRPVPARVLESG